MKIKNKNICLTNKLCMLVITGVFFTTIVLAATWPGEVEEFVKDKDIEVESEMWIPTEEDILYQDSMYSIIESTQNDITEIKEDIIHILERLDYEDGTYDSIRYVKGGKIDRKRN